MSRRFFLNRTVDSSAPPPRASNSMSSLLSGGDVQTLPAPPPRQPSQADPLTNRYSSRQPPVPQTSRLHALATPKSRPPPPAPNSSSINIGQSNQGSSGVEWGGGSAVTVPEHTARRMSQGVVAPPSTSAQSPTKKGSMSLADMLKAAPATPDPKPAWDGDFDKHDSLRLAHVGSIHDGDSPPPARHKSGVTGLAMARKASRVNKPVKSTPTKQVKTSSKAVSMAIFLNATSQPDVVVRTTPKRMDPSVRPVAGASPRGGTMADYMSAQSQPDVVVRTTPSRADPSSRPVAGASHRGGTMADYMSAQSQPDVVVRTTPSRADPSSRPVAGTSHRGGTMADYLSAQSQPDVAVRVTPKRLDPEARETAGMARGGQGEIGEYLGEGGVGVETPRKMDPANVRMKAGMEGGRGSSMAQYLGQKEDSGTAVAVEDEVEKQRLLWAKWGMSPPAKEAYGGN